MAELRFPDPLLTDGAVRLRPWEAGDVAFVVETCRDERVSLYSPSIPFPYSEADALGWFEHQEPARLSGEAIDFAIVDAASGQQLGAISLLHVDLRFMNAETGYWLAREARGRGYVSRAVRLIVGWAFDDLQILRVALKADPQNLESQRVAERCGFRREGHLRSDMVVAHSGERRDSLIFGLLPGELR